MPKLTIQLQPANKNDFVELIKKGEYKVRLGVPFWLYNSKGDIEPKNYITNETTTFNDLKEWFDRKQILTIKP